MRRNEKVNDRRQRGRFMIVDERKRKKVSQNPLISRQGKPERRFVIERGGRVLSLRSQTGTSATEERGNCNPNYRKTGTRTTD